MADIDTAKLRAVASAATQGEWWSAGGYVTSRHPESVSFSRSIYHIDELGQEVSQGPFQAVPFAHARDAAHVAAFQPATALALLDEIDHLRALLKRAGEALRPFAGLAVEDQEMPVADDMRVSIPLMSKEPWREIFVGNLRAARAAAREIEETLGHE